MEEIHLFPIRIPEKLWKIEEITKTKNRIGSRVCHGKELALKQTLKRLRPSRKKPGTGTGTENWIREVKTEGRTGKTHIKADDYIAIIDKFKKRGCGFVCA